MRFILSAVMQVYTLLLLGCSLSIFWFRKAYYRVYLTLHLTEIGWTSPLPSGGVCRSCYQEQPQIRQGACISNQVQTQYLVCTTPTLLVISVTLGLPALPTNTLRMKMILEGVWMR